MVSPFIPVVTTVDSALPDALLAGHDQKTRDFTLLSGQNLARGTLLGQITASKKVIASLSAAVDGSQTPMGILADDINATGGDANAPVYVFGSFVEDEITYGASHTAATVRDGLRDLGIFLKSAVGR